MRTSAEIRTAFLEFFKSKGHTIVPSAPIVIKNDPTLMFTNAGMNQFKDYFLGNKKATYSRVADTQKCLRVSGKHNDLEEVGVDTYHHTMFEMLGNWSFGDYFKKEAIEWSWELLTQLFQIPIDRLYVTVFEGDAAEGLEFDAEAYEEWKTWTGEDRILKGKKKDNFWEMGDTGPCGPCTEIHVDMRSDAERKATPGKDLVNKDHPQVLEIWNNVFIQYNRLKDGTLEPLPQRHVDTGMGFERLVRVLQGKSSNYDTDIFTGTFEAIQNITGKVYKGGDSKGDIAFRVLADHIRAIGFTIADGQMPSNTGAGYVIRRILRRAVRYYYSYLDYQQPLLYQLLPVIATQFEAVFPELHQQERFVTKAIKEEEEAFLRTLDKGLKKIDDVIQNNQSLTGAEAFELYDTYGFPLDLTKLIASEKSIEVDEEGFNAEMQKQKARSRAATAIDAGDWTIIKEDKTVFTGYTSLEESAHILRYRQVKKGGKEVYQIVLNQTPFYAESGGQVGDMGFLKSSGADIKIIDTKKENDLIIHITEAMPEVVHDDVLAAVDAPRREAIMRHHSATHLLHAALREVLGTHVTQKGSLVAPDYLRFDMAHFSKITDEEIDAVEKIVNEKIRQNIPVVIDFMSKEEAMKSGAMALFGEKYSDVVRVVTIDAAFSKELCGGTHVAATGELGFFKITAEGAVAAGVRRIEAVCGAAAENFVHGELKKLEGIKAIFKNPKDLGRTIMQMQESYAALQKRIETFEAASTRQLTESLRGKVQHINGVQFIGEVIEADSADILKKIAFDLKAFLKNYVVVLAAKASGKAHVLVMIDDALAKEKNWDASAIIKQHIAPLINGGGGGQKTLATAGGANLSALHQAVETVKSLL